VTGPPELKDLLTKTCCFAGLSSACCFWWNRRIGFTRWAPPASCHCVIVLCHCGRFDHVTVMQDFSREKDLRLRSYSLKEFVALIFRCSTILAAYACIIPVRSEEKLGNHSCPATKICKGECTSLPLPMCDQTVVRFMVQASAWVAAISTPA